MPDLLSHVFLAYTICTLLALRWEWLDPRYVTVGMAGAFIPDLAKVYLLVPHATVGNALGVPFSWFSLHTLGGAVLSVGVGVVLVSARERRRVAALLSLGAGSHLLADAMLQTPWGRAYPLFWPVSGYVPPSPGLYHSTDVWMSLVTGGLALVAWLVVRRRRGRTATEPETRADPEGAGDTGR